MGLGTGLMHAGIDVAGILVELKDGRSNYGGTWTTRSSVIMVIWSSLLSMATL
jgi:hypothetical protein